MDSLAKIKSLPQKLFPTGFKAELKELTVLAWPVTLCTFLSFLPAPVALIFCGHLGKQELDAAALSVSVINVTGIYICTGLSTACDTLFSQAFGGKHMKLMVIYFQRSLIIITLSCFICWSVHLNAGSLLLLLHQDPLVTRLAADYLIFFMPGLMCNFVYQVCVKFLQTQNVVIPTVVFGAIGNVFNIISQYVLVYVCDFGIRGSAIALGLSWLVACLLVIIYIARNRVRDNWKGCSWKVLEDWGPFLRLALAGLAMIAAEWCTYEAGIFLAGLLGIVQQGALAISGQIDWASFMIILGFSIACSIRVGQNLGSGNSAGAKTSYRVARFTTCCIIAVSITAMMCLRHRLPYIFTTDKAVGDLAAEMIPAVAIIQIIDTFTGISAAALRGCGLQWISGVLNVLGCFVIAFPAGIAFMFPAHCGAMGIYYGTIVGTAPIAIIYIIGMLYLDWDKQAEKAVRLHGSAGIPLVEDETTGTGNKTGMNGNSSKLEIETGSTDSSGNTEESYLLNSTDINSTTPPSRGLFIRRTVSCGLVFAVFCGAICVRLFVPFDTRTHPGFSTTDFVPVYNSTL